MRSDPVIIGIATYDGPGRRKSLRETINSLKGQADCICIYCNDLISWHNLGGLLVHKLRDYGDICDSGKYAGHIFHRDSGHLDSHYVLTCDDDLIYPPDYVETMIAAIERHDRKAVVSCHGRVYYPPVSSYYGSFGDHLERGIAENFRCTDEVRADQDIPVITVGTGVSAFHSDAFKDNPITMKDFPHPKMADIWFSKKCNEIGIPRFVIPHAAGWIKQSEKIDLNESVTRKQRNQDGVETGIFNSVDWKL